MDEPLKLKAAAFAAVLRSVRPTLVLVCTTGCDFALLDIDYAGLGYNVLEYKSIKQIRSRVTRDHDSGASLLVYGNMPAADIAAAFGEGRSTIVCTMIANARGYRASRPDDPAQDVRAAITANHAAHAEYVEAMEGSMVSLLMYA